MHIQLKTVSRECPENLSGLPVVEDMVKTIEPFFEISEVKIDVVKKDREFSVYFGFPYFQKGAGEILKGLHVKYAVYTYKNPAGEVHITISPEFCEHGFPFNRYFDHESTADNFPDAFFSLINGVHSFIEKISQEILNENSRLTAKFSKKQLKKTKHFYAREYC